MQPFFFPLPLLFTLLPLSLLFLPTTSRPPSKLAFGSCNRFFQSHPLDIFPSIISLHPSHMLFLGDFVYLDRPVYFSFRPRWYSQQSQPQILRKFNTVLSSPQFKAFASNNITVEIIWDDHDYNLNNGGTSNPMRFKMLEIFKTLFGSVTVFKDSLHKVVKVDEKVSMVLLDVRSYNTGETVFNEETWGWLERVFQNTTKQQLIIISSGIQVIYDDRVIMEKWDVDSRVRLYRLLDKYSVHAMVLSGDIHFAQLGVRQRLHEITSSGLSFSIENHVMMAGDILDTFVPERYSKVGERYYGRNFGFVEVHYGEGERIEYVLMQVRDKEGKVVLEKKVGFEEMVVGGGEGGGVDWEDLARDHKDVFEENMWKKIRENPLGMLKYFPFLYPVGYFVFAVIELCHWKID